MSDDDCPGNVFSTGETGAKKLSRLAKAKAAGEIAYAKAKQSVYCVFRGLKP